MMIRASVVALPAFVTLIVPLSVMLVPAPPSQIALALSHAAVAAPSHTASLPGRYQYGSLA